MELSQEQVININSVIDASNELLELMRKGIRDAAPRLKRLADAGLHIERFMDNGQLVEHAIKGVLQACKLKRQVSEIVGAPDPYAHIGNTKEEKSDFEKRFRKCNKETLGRVVRLFEQTTGETELAKKLQDFNTFRIEFIHQAFNGYHSLEEMDKQADEYLNSVEYNEMVMEILPVHYRVQAETSALHIKK